MPSGQAGQQSKDGASKWSYAATQSLLDKAKRFEEEGMTTEANNTRDEAVEKAKVGLNKTGATKAVHWNPTMREIEKVPDREVNVGRQSITSAGNLRGSIRHGDVHATQERAGSNGLGPKNELEALQQELDYAEEDQLTPGEINDPLKKIGSQVKDLEGRSRWWNKHK
jgi:hypothetical protein